jgi:hypothetical protein
MLLVGDDNAREASWLQGATAAFLVGALAVIVGGATDQLRALLTEPQIVGLGLAVASLLGAALARRAAMSRLPVAIGIAVAYGLVVPMLVAALIALPLAPIAAMLATVAWPVTVPAAMAWLAVVRWDRSRVRLGQVPAAAAAVTLATLLLVLRFTQPAATFSAAAGECVTFPGERIAAIALSPDGVWLGVGSERDGEGIVRVIEQSSGKIIELARGPYVDAVGAGVAVGPLGETTYLVDVQGASALPEDEGAALWVASPSEPARRYADVPTPGLSNLTWTPDGIAAIQWVDPLTWTEIHRPVWVRPNTAVADAFESIPPAEILDYRVLAPLVNTTPGGAIEVKTPTGDRNIARPSDASGEVSVTADGAYLVFHVRALTDDEMDEKYSDVVAESTENGRRVVLVPGEGWAPRVAAGRVAYLTFPAYPDNSVCVKAVTIE